MAKNIIFPGGKKFAFTVFDDTDQANLEKIKPVYDFLNSIGLKTTKSVWVFPNNYSDPNFPVETLQDFGYLNFIKNLNSKGFEIALHGVAPVASVRDKTIQGIEQFKNFLGFPPSSYAVHWYNRENLYWDGSRLRSRLLKFLMNVYKRQKEQYFQGHLEKSLYFWGDICKKHIQYVRNFTFNDINTLKINPTLPYKDSRKPYVNFWFSSSDGWNVEKFNELISRKNQEKLEREGGVCIAYTHFAFGFVKDGKLNHKTKELLAELSKRNGWFVPVTVLLDYLRNQRQSSEISSWELMKMEYRWFFEKIIEKIFKF